jgi:hypothetical protein
MTLLERNTEILARLGRLQEVAEPIAQIFREGKREQLLAGADAGGFPFAPLAPSTLSHRQGSGPPLAPNGSSSRVITGYVVSVEVDARGLTISAGWPALDWIKYHRTGTKRMPKRDPGGFRDQDKAAATKVIEEFIFRG